eukprot:g2798.t1
MHGKNFNLYEQKATAEAYFERKLDRAVALATRQVFRFQLNAIPPSMLLQYAATTPEARGWHEANAKEALDEYLAPLWMGREVDENTDVEDAVKRVGAAIGRGGELPEDVRTGRPLQRVPPFLTHAPRLFGVQRQEVLARNAGEARSKAPTWTVEDEWAFAKKQTLSEFLDTAVGLSRASVWNLVETEHKAFPSPTSTESPKGGENVYTTYVRAERDFLRKLRKAFNMDGSPSSSTLLERNTLESRRLGAQATLKLAYSGGGAAWTEQERMGFAAEALSFLLAGEDENKQRETARNFAMLPKSNPILSDENTGFDSIPFDAFDDLVFTLEELVAHPGIRAKNVDPFLIVPKERILQSSVAVRPQLAHLTSNRATDALVVGLTAAGSLTRVMSHQY